MKKILLIILLSLSFGASFGTLFDITTWTPNTTTASANNTRDEFMIMGLSGKTINLYQGRMARNTSYTAPDCPQWRMYKQIETGRTFIGSGIIDYATNSGLASFNLNLGPGFYKNILRTSTGGSACNTQRGSTTANANSYYNPLNRFLELGGATNTSSGTAISEVAINSLKAGMNRYIFSGDDPSIIKVPTVFYNFVMSSGMSLGSNLYLDGMTPTILSSGLDLYFNYTQHIFRSLFRSH